MSYTPTVWQTGDTITAEKLNKLENGVANVGGYDIVFTFSGENLTADGLSFEELCQKGANIRAKYVFTDADMESVIDSICCSYTPPNPPLGDTIEFVFINDNGQFMYRINSDILIERGGEDTYNYTYTYSNGHYVFTESGT